MIMGAWRNWVGTTRASHCVVMGRLLLAGILAVLLAIPATSHASDDSDVGEAIAAILAREEPIALDGVALKAAWLRELYEGRTGSPLWHDRVDAVTKVL